MLILGRPIPHETPEMRDDCARRGNLQLVRERKRDWMRER